MSCHYFYKHFSLSITYADTFIPDEEEWLINSAMGGLIWAENHTVLKYGCEYDINSMYHYLMTQCAYITRQPIFDTIQTLDDIKHNIYCIVRCKISNYDKRIFKNNKYNFTQEVTFNLLRKRITQLKLY